MLASLDPSLPTVNCQDPKQVDYLLAHPGQINWIDFSSNPHPNAIRYMLSRPNQVDWEAFNQNESDMAVRYLLSHPHRFDVGEFVFNSNNLAVDYVLTQMLNELVDVTYGHDFSDNLCTNTNERMVQFVLDHLEELGLDGSELCRNSSQTATSYILSHMGTKFHPHMVYLNPNPRLQPIALEYLTQTDQIHLMCPHIFWNPCSIYPVYMWTHCKSNVLYRLPIELVRMICDFV